MVQLAAFWIVQTHRAETEEHLRHDGVRITLDMIDPMLRLVQEPVEQHLALQVLVWHVHFRRIDIQSCMTQLAEQTPGRTVWLFCWSETLCTYTTAFQAG